VPPLLLLLLALLPLLLLLPAVVVVDSAVAVLPAAMRGAVTCRSWSPWRGVLWVEGERTRPREGCAWRPAEGGGRGRVRLLRLGLRGGPWVALPGLGLERCPSGRREWNCF